MGFESNHHYLKDGQLHTIHVLNDSTGAKTTGVYIPKEFSLTKYIGGRMASAIFTNAATEQVIRASHILILADIQFDAQGKDKTTLTTQEKTQLANQIKKNMQTPPNIKGSRYIGETGGPQGGGETGKHAHLTIFKNEKLMETGLTNKYAVGEIGDYKDNSKKYIGDFRSLIPKI